MTTMTAMATMPRSIRPPGHVTIPSKRSLKISDCLSGLATRDHRCSALRSFGKRPQILRMVPSPRSAAVEVKGSSRLRLQSGGFVEQRVDALAALDDLCSISKEDREAMNPVLL